MSPSYPERSVLIVGNFLSHLGRSRGVCEELAERLSADGWRVIAASRRASRAGRMIDMLGTAWKRRRDYAGAQVDVYSGFAFIWAAALAIVLRTLSKRFVFTLHGGGLPSFARRWPRLVGWVLGRATTVTAPSEFLRRSMAGWRRDIIVLPNAIEVGRYRTRAYRATRARLIWLRAFHEIYDPSLGPAVIALLRPDFPDVRLTMIGPDRHDGSLERTLAAAKELGVSELLRIVPGIPKESVGGALSEADIFLNTTRVDNAPVSVLEAMACGLCVVSTDVGGVPDLVEDGEDGILVPAGDAAAMAAGVRYLLNDQELATRLSQNARRKAESYDWSVLLPKWECILKAAVGNK